MITQTAVDSIQLPPHTHAQLLVGRDVVDGSQLVHIVVWADRHYNRCPGCGQQIAVDPGCPVVLNAGAGQGGRIEEVSQQHGCGYWLRVLSAATVVDSDAIEQVERYVLSVAGDLSAGRASRVETLRSAFAASLRDDLAAAITRLAEPIEDGETLEDREREVLCGSEVDPGVYREDGEVRAWCDGPVGNDPIVVTAADLAVSA